MLRQKVVELQRTIQQLEQENKVLSFQINSLEAEKSAHFESLRKKRAKTDANFDETLLTPRTRIQKAKEQQLQEKKEKIILKVKGKQVSEYSQLISFNAPGTKNISTVLLSDSVIKQSSKVALYFEMKITKLIAGYVVELCFTRLLERLQLVFLNIFHLKRNFLVKIRL